MKGQIEPAFEPPDVVKRGPHGGTLRWLSGEGKVIESFIDATTGQPTQAEIHEDQIVYQATDGSPISPFDHTVIVDIVDNRPIEECTLGAPKATPQAYSSEVAYGTVVPREFVDQLGPSEKGSTLDFMVGDNLVPIAEKLEKTRTALYFPFVKRKGLTVHLAVAYAVRNKGELFLQLRCFGGTIIWNRPLRSVAIAPEIAKPMLARPTLRARKPAAQ